MTLENKIRELNSLQKDYAQISNHPFSNFSKNKIVFGVGDPNSKLLFLGEGPGAQEDLIGEPFVGKAGQLLTKIIAAMGYTREQVYITNVIKCRLENNRPPTPDEIAYEKEAILNKELAILAPKIICCLGASATSAILGSDSKLSSTRGKFFEHNQSTIIPTYHPAYLLRNPSAKKFVWEDMQKIMNYLKGLEDCSNALN